MYSIEKLIKDLRDIDFEFCEFYDIFTNCREIIVPTKEEEITLSIVFDNAHGFKRLSYIGHPYEFIIKNLVSQNVVTGQFAYIDRHHGTAKAKYHESM